MAMQTYDIKDHDERVADAPLCSTCDEPMRIKDATFSHRKIEITYRCNTCEAQVKESSDSLQG